jgi:hypothetical protein
MVALSATLFAEVIALFVGKDGDLPFPLRQRNRLVIQADVLYYGA